MTYDRARRVRTRIGALYAGFREDEELRFEPNAERLEDRPQIAGASVVPQRSSVRDLIPQLRHAIRRRPSCVLNDRMILQRTSVRLLRAR